MTISLKKAFKAPLEKGFLFPCVILYINALLFTMAFPFDPITTLCILSAGLLCQLILLGYQLLFARNAVRQKTPLFPLLSIETIGYGLKSVIFGLLSYVFLGIMAIPVYLLALFKVPFWLFSFVLIFELLFAFLYLMTAWTRFTYTGKMLQPLKVIDTVSYLALNWRSYLKITLYMIAAFVISIIPAFFVKFISALGVMYYTPFIYGHLFVLATVQLYVTFVILHIMAQGYIDIEVKMNTLPIQPVVISTPQMHTTKTAQKKPATKKIAPVAKKSDAQKAPITKKSAPKKKSAKVTKKAK